MELRFDARRQSGANAEIGHGYESRLLSPTRIRGRLPPFGGPASPAHASNLHDRCRISRHRWRKRVLPPFSVDSVPQQGQRVVLL